MTDLHDMGRRARRAQTALNALSGEEKDRLLLAAADALVADTASILEANGRDMANGRKKQLPEGLLDRLLLDETRIEGIAAGVRQVAALPDPVGERMEAWTTETGLSIEKRRVPLGVIGIIYEARPNVTADAFALCFKAGNATILKGGSDALYSNEAITNCLRRALDEQGLPADALQLIADTDRALAREFMRQKDTVDVLIPRGSAALIASVVEHATIPVIETGSGNCHIYVDKSADLDMALSILINAKTQRVGVCNAAESLVVHADAAAAFLPMAAKALREHRVLVRADEQALSFVPDAGWERATEEDFAAEYLDYIISVKCVHSLEEAIAHINRYHTSHSDAIVTSDAVCAERFLNEIDSACVYVNASTRFTDGFEFGFGAEIGISTQKLHARGPMGLRELTSYRYRITGNGQIRA